MATADGDGEGKSKEETAAGGATADLSTRLSTASFVRILTRPDGDGVAAAGILARALTARGVPFQVSTAHSVEDRVQRAETVDDATTVTVLVGAGAESTRPAEGVTRLPNTAPGPGPVSLSVRAWRVATDLLSGDGPTEDGQTTAVGTLALAGAVAAGHTPGTAGTTPVLDALDGLERRTGVAVPVADPVDGLAHSTLVHAPFSGSPERVRETLGEAVDLDATLADDDAARDLASAVTLATLAADGTTAASADAVERFLRPRVGGPLSTVGGYADVLGAVARESPGMAVALALGHDVRDPALAAWRDHGRRAHESVRSAATGRYDGMLAVRAEEPAPVGTVARLVAAYRSPEPVVAVVTDDRVAVAVRPGTDLSSGMTRVLRTALNDARVDGSSRRAIATLPDETESTAVVAALREVLT